MTVISEALSCFTRSQQDACQAQVGRSAAVWRTCGAAAAAQAVLGHDADRAAAHARRPPGVQSPGMWLESACSSLVSECERDGSGDL